MMPEMDGLQFIVQCRKVNHRIPIAVISGYGDIKNATFALTRGAFNFITKPFTLKEVENIIRKGLRLRELSLGTDRLLKNIRNRTEITIPSYTHLLPSVTLLYSQRMPVARYRQRKSAQQYLCLHRRNPHQCTHCTATKETRIKLFQSPYSLILKNSPLPYRTKEMDLM